MECGTSQVAETGRLGYKVSLSDSNRQNQSPVCVIAPQMSPWPEPTAGDGSTKGPVVHHLKFWGHLPIYHNYSLQIRYAETGSSIDNQTIWHSCFWGEKLEKNGQGVQQGLLNRQGTEFTAIQKALLAVHAKSRLRGKFLLIHKVTLLQKFYLCKLFARSLQSNVSNIGRSWWQFWIAIMF